MTRKLPKVINQKEFEVLIKYTLRKKHPKYKQFAIAILLGFEAGMRISEIVGLEDIVPKLIQERIDLRQNTIRVEAGKGQKDRIVPLPKRFNTRLYGFIPLTISRRSLQRYVTLTCKQLFGKHLTFHC